MHNLLGRNILLIGSLFFAIFLIGCDSHPKADLVIHNGNIYTVDEYNPTVEMVAVQGDKIVAVGSATDKDRWIGEKTQVLDLQGKTMTPGLIESHGHIMGLGYSKMRLDLNNVANYRELVAMVEEAAKKSSPGEWIVGRGWHQSKWEPLPEPSVRGFPVHEALSKVSPNNPVFLNHASGHAGFANAKAMEIAGVNAKTQFSDDGEIIRDSRGQPTGVFVENASYLIEKHIPETTPESDRRALELAIDASLASGVTTFHDAGSSGESIEVYKEFLAAGKMKIRLWVMLLGSEKELLQEWYAKGPEIASGNNHLTIRAIKLWADGALGSRGAWLLEPYSDRAGHTGHETIPMDYVEEVANDALANDFQLCVHAIGDRANREVLDRFQKAFEANSAKANDHRFRIEHAQHLNADDIPRFAEMDVIASMQGIHMSSDRPWAIDRLGKERIEEGAYVWQKLLTSGAVIINGTDVPVEPISAIACFYASVTRKTLKGTPEGGYEPAQKMTREQALRSYTLDAAFGGFEEDIKGSIVVGKLADFTVFDQDIMTVEEDQLLATQVTHTIVGGDILYQR